MIRIGPAGWKYKDWEGIVYPNPAPRGFNPLAYIADYFTTVEISQRIIPRFSSVWAGYTATARGRKSACSLISSRVFRDSAPYAGAALKVCPEGNHPTRRIP